MYYTYIHRFADTGEVFYVGMSKAKTRATTKLRNNQPQWYAAVANREWYATLLVEWDTKANACAHEMALIKLYREKGYPLVNLTDGGEGRKGFKWTLAEHEKQRPMQQKRGKLGGAAVTKAKQEAAKTNGKLGGRPKSKVQHIMLPIG